MVAAAPTANNNTSGAASPAKVPSRATPTALLIRGCSPTTMSALSMLARPDDVVAPPIRTSEAWPPADSLSLGDASRKIKPLTDTTSCETASSPLVASTSRYPPSAGVVMLTRTSSTCGSVPHADATRMLTARKPTAMAKRRRLPHDSTLPCGTPCHREVISKQTSMGARRYAQHLLPCDGISTCLDAVTPTAGLQVRSQCGLARTPTGDRRHLR